MKTSDEASEPPAESSVYDFLYYDARRIASYLSQLSQYGSPGRVRHQERSGGASTRAFANRGQLSIPQVATGERTAQNETRTEYDETFDREYDPIWLGGLSLYDELDGRGLIQTDLPAAQIGAFVDLRGALGIMDFTMFRALWDRRSVHSLIQSGVDGAVAKGTVDARFTNRAERRRQGTSAVARPEPPSTGEMISDIIAAIPHRVQARLLTEARQSIWATLREDSLVMDAADVYLKHGLALDGRWRVFGVLDALPKTSATDPLKAEVVNEFAASPFGTMAISMLPLLESGFSRPAAAWGISPIMIFRELSAR